jgi:hypothetical protein
VAGPELAVHAAPAGVSARHGNNEGPNAKPNLITSPVYSLYLASNVQESAAETDPDTAPTLPSAPTRALAATGEDPNPAGTVVQPRLSDLRSRGLCLVPISCTDHVARDGHGDGADL